MMLRYAFDTVQQPAEARIAHPKRRKIGGSRRWRRSCDVRAGSTARRKRTHMVILEDSEVRLLIAARASPSPLRATADKSARQPSRGDRSCQPRELTRHAASRSSPKGERGWWEAGIRNPIRSPAEPCPTVDDLPVARENRPSKTGCMRVRKRRYIDLRRAPRRA